MQHKHNQDGEGGTDATGMRGEEGGEEGVEEQNK